MTRKKIKLSTGAEAEVIEHAPGEWSGYVPAEREDWEGQRLPEHRLAETEAAWAETEHRLAETKAAWAGQIARTSAQNRQNATKVTAEEIVRAVAEARQRLKRSVTQQDVANHLNCTVKTVGRVLKASGLTWKELQK